MTISSSLNAGVTGLNVNASKLATISDNIANSGTYGYKRAETEFSSLVVSQSKGSYTAGGVRATSTREVSAQGSLITTDNPLDIAIGGRGMIPVTSVAAAQAGGATTPFLLTSTGSFRPDDEGLLRTSSGLALLGWPADNEGNIPQQPRDSVSGLEPVRIYSQQFAFTPTTSIGLGVNLPATDTQAGSPGTPLTVPVEYFDNVGASQSLTATFTPTVPATGSSNTWTLSVDDSASPAASNPVAEFVLTFDNARGSGGSLLSVTPSFGGTYDATTGEIDISVLGGPMSMVVGEPGSTTHLTQLSADFAPTGITKNGSQVGTMTGVEVDENGFINAVYDTGLVRTIYQVPVADVPNFNGLRPEDNQAFSITEQSGAMYLWDGGDGPTGGVIGYALEESTTDIAGELTQLIETQRAYSSNAKIIQTVDEMLQETTNIKR